MRYGIVSSLLILIVFGQTGFLGSGAKGDALIEQGQDFAEVVPLVEYLGPLAPVALSPFFGIALLSGAAVLADWGLIPGNAFLSNSQTLSNPLVFLAFLSLAAFTSLPKLTKVTKPVAQAADQLESYAGIATIAILQGVVMIQAGESGTEEAIVQAGFISATSSAVIMFLSAINLFVINTVKFVFEVLIWLCPIPTVDAIFEAALKAICTGLIFIYLTSPWLSAMLNGVLFLICLLVFRWAYRVMNYYRVVLFGPIAWGFLRGFGLARAASVSSTGVPGAVRKAYPDREVVLPVYPSARMRGFPRRVRALLVRTSDGRCLILRRNWRGKLLEIPVGRILEVGRGIIAHWINLETADGFSLKLQFSKKFNPCLPSLAAKLQAPLSGAYSPSGAENWRSMAREMGREARGNEATVFRRDLA